MSMLRNFRRGIQNIIRWVPVIWNDVDWDHSALLRIMETKLRWMAKSSEHWPTVGANRQVKRMRVCAELLRRVNKDEYFVNSGYNRETWDSLPDWKRTQIAKHALKQPTWDLEYFAKIFSKNVQSWWS